jgi:hypothetical protein
MLGVCGSSNMHRINVFVAADSDEPTITMISGSNTTLGLGTDNRNGKWYLIVKNTQDYENSIQRNYRFYAYVGGTPYEVYITVVNVDDETPYFDLPDSSPCEIHVSNALNKLHVPSTDLP